MIPLYQTRFWRSETERGNCWQAAVASVLELPLEEVPDFIQDDVDSGEPWWPKFVAWCGERGIEPIELRPPLQEAPPGEYVVGTAATPDGRGYHAFVARDGRMAHDPANTGWTWPVEMIIRLVPKSSGTGVDWSHD